MKRTLIGGFLTLVGSIWCLAGLLATAVKMEEVGSWATPPGRFGTAMIQSGLTWIVAPGGILLALGLLILVVEFFKKEDR